jgi:hypothetical protein
MSGENVKTVTAAIAATKPIDVVRTLAIASSILWPNLDSISGFDTV